MSSVRFIPMELDCPLFCNRSTKIHEIYSNHDVIISKIDSASVNETLIDTKD